MVEVNSDGRKGGVFAYAAMTRIPTAGGWRGPRVGSGRVAFGAIDLEIGQRRTPSGSRSASVASSRSVETVRSCQAASDSARALAAAVA